MKTSSKNIIMIAIGIITFLLAESCGDSLGIEDNYSKKLISGKEIKELSYKEIVRITRDTLIFYSDTTIHVDTVHYPVYDTVPNSKPYPSKGFIFDMYSIIYSSYYSATYYPLYSYASIARAYTINDIPFIDVEFELDYAITAKHPLFKEFSELPKKISVKLSGINMMSNYHYYLDGAITSSNYGSVDVISSQGGRLSYESKNSGLSFYLNRVITAPDDPKRILYFSAYLLYHSKSTNADLLNMLNFVLY